MIDIGQTYNGTYPEACHSAKTERDTFSASVVILLCDALKQNAAHIQMLLLSLTQSSHQETKIYTICILPNFAEP